MLWAMIVVRMPWKSPSSHPTSCAWATRSSADVGSAGSRSSSWSTSSRRSSESSSRSEATVRFHCADRRPLLAADLRVAHLPRRGGEQVLSLDEALRQDIRELHIGLLNMMPDAALKVTEQQFIRLIGSANQIVQIYVHPSPCPA
jgi:hypothetical protein